MLESCLRPLSIFCLILLLASCQFMPSQTGSRQPVNANIVPAFGTKSEGPGQPEMLTFPSMVTPQKLEPVNKRFEEGTGYKLNFSTLPHKKPNKPKHIQVPAQGPLQLTLQPGPTFALLDANGLDGQATVQLPTDVYQGYLRLGGPASTSQPLSLKYEDPLYYVDHTLGRDDLEKPKGSFTVLAQNDNKLKITPHCSGDPDSQRVWQITNPTSNPIEYRWEIKDSDQEGIEVAPPGDSYLETDTETGSNTLVLNVNNKKHDSQAGKADRCAPGQAPAADTSRWWNLGSRSLPVPANWHSDHGQNLVLKLSNQGISDFTMRWVRTPGKQVAFPPGIKEIGPEGGIVELPGVGSLEIPQQAILLPTVIRIKQLLTAPNRQTRCINEEAKLGCVPGENYLSPIVKVEPLNLTLNKPADLYLNVPNIELYGHFQSSYMSFLATHNILESKSTNARMFKEGLPFDIKVPIIKFGIFSKLISTTLDISSNQDQGFRIQNLPLNPIETEHIKVFSSVANIHKEELGQLSDYLEKSYVKYISSGFTAPNHVLNGGKILIFFDPLVISEDKIVAGVADLYCIDEIINTYFPTNSTIFNNTTGSELCTPLIKLTYCKNNAKTDCEVNGTKIAETSAHEMFHIFQDAHVTKKSELTRSLKNQWYAESSAEWAGEWYVSNFHKDINLNNFDPYKLEFESDALHEIKHSLIRRNRMVNMTCTQKRYQHEL